MSVQVATLKDLQDAIFSYLNGYTDGNGVQWPGVFSLLQPVPATIWDFEGGPRPTVFPYVSMNVVADRHIGQGYQSPAVPQRDGQGNITEYSQGVFWSEDHEVSFQAYGANSRDILDLLHDTFEAPWWHDILDGLGLVAREHTDPRDISMIIDGASPERRWVMDVTFGSAAEIDNLNIPWIEFVQLNETFIVVPQDSSTPGQIVTPPPVQVGQ